MLMFMLYMQEIPLFEMGEVISLANWHKCKQSSENNFDDNICFNT